MSGARSPAPKDHRGACSTRGTAAKYLARITERRARRVKGLTAAIVVSLI
jgi:hypothetical protein